MTLNVSFEILNNARGTITIDDELLEKLAEREGVSLDDMDGDEIWDMLVDYDPGYDDKAREIAFENFDPEFDPEFGYVRDIEIIR